MALRPGSKPSGSSESHAWSWTKPTRATQPEAAGPDAQCSEPQPPPPSPAIPLCPHKPRWAFKGTPSSPAPNCQGASESRPCCSCLQQHSPSCKRSHWAGRRQSEAASACQRSSVGHSPVPERRGRESQFRRRCGLGASQSPEGEGAGGGSYLEERHFAHDVVVHVDGKVQPHLVWKLHHQL